MRNQFSSLKYLSLDIFVVDFYYLLFIFNFPFFVIHYPRCIFSPENSKLFYLPLDKNDCFTNRDDKFVRRVRA